MRTIDTDLRTPAGTGGDDAAADTVTVNTTNGDDVVVAEGAGGAVTAAVNGEALLVSMVGANPANDRLIVNDAGRRRRRRRLRPGRPTPRS